VTEPGSVLLDRAQLERAFTAPGERLVRRGIVADVVVVGGAAIACSSIPETAPRPAAPAPLFRVVY
jgi:hypothetical protein